jgi:EAL domain-containing protein (putative c-di-GMP-specific phosphodiesterase class I)
MAYLRRRTLQELKIDKAFVQDLALPQGSDALAVVADRNAGFVNLILKLAETLHLQVVAEGVETQEQFTALCAMWCTRFQGYLFGKPMPLSQAVALARPIG